MDEKRLTLPEALEEIRRLRSILQDVLEAAKGGEPLRPPALEPKTRPAGRQAA